VNGVVVLYLLVFDWSSDEVKMEMDVLLLELRRAARGEKRDG
jgi:hypothetical protein